LWGLGLYTFMRGRRSGIKSAYLVKNVFVS